MVVRPKILIVEDDAPTAELLKILLAKVKCQVALALTGKEAMQLANEDNYQLIILDVRLPDINGFEIFQRLHQIPDLSNTPIVFISGHVDDKSWRRGLELGAADYIEKPFHGTAFVRRILSHLKAKPRVYSTR